MYVDLDFYESVPIMNSSSQSFYVMSSNNKVASIVASKESANPVASDDHIDIHAPARYTYSPWGGGTSTPNGESISWCVFELLIPIFL